MSGKYGEVYPAITYKSMGPVDYVRLSSTCTKYGTNIGGLGRLIDCALLEKITHMSTVSCHFSLPSALEVRA